MIAQLRAVGSLTGTIAGVQIRRAFVQSLTQLVQLSQVVRRASNKVNATLAAEVGEIGQLCAELPAPALASSVPACFTSSCGWLDGTESCSDTDTSCVCNVFNSAGSGAISNCESRVNTFNVTFASEIEQVAQDCQTTLRRARRRALALSATPTSSVPAPATTTRVTTATSVALTSLTTTTHSGASDAFRDTLRTGYFPFVMLLALVAGMFCLL